VGNSYKIIIFSLFSLLLFTQSALALSSTGSTDKFNYKINETINYTGSADQNLTSNVTIYLFNSSGTQFNFTSKVPNAINFTAQVNATVPRSGDYLVKANFTFNDTYFESSSIVKISRAHSTVIGTSKGTYSPGETINFTVRATDANSVGVSDENITVRLLYVNNGTVLNSVSGSTNSAGEYAGTFTAPSTIGSYRLTVNEWVATKIIDISTFDLVVYTGDADGNIKTNFAAGDTAFVYMDIFDTNKTRFTGTEILSLQLTYPNGNQNASVSYTFSGSRLNTSFAANGTGIFNVKVTAVSTSKFINIPVLVGKYEIIGWLEKNTTATNTFFGNEPVNIRVKVFNVSTGETIKTTLDDTFELNLLDSVFTNVSSISSTATLDSATGVRTFTFNTPNTTGLYYVRVRLNQSKTDIDMKVTNTIATVTPVDQSYNFKNAFVGSKQTIRIMSTLSNSTSSINVTNVSVVSVRTSSGSDVTSSLTFNTSIVDHKDAKVGLVEFSAPAGAGLYFIKTLANNNFAAETQFFIKLYTVCAQLDGYRWFISSNEDANLTIKVSEAQDVSLIDSISGNSSDSTSTEGGSFGNMYGMHDCYGAYKTTASGGNTTGNSVAGIVMTVKKIFNTLNGEDVTTKVANLQSNNTDENGKVTLRLSKPSGGWDGGTYVVELELRDKNNNTDKGFGAFQVKNLWVNVWPQQVGGRWKWYFSPNETMRFDINAYNSTGTWSYYGQGQGTGDNCTVLGVFYTGNGAEWFWPPKTVSTSKYTWTCTNSTSPANGRFNLTINHTTAFDSGYYMVRVKVNTTAGVGDSGEGWFAVKAYNVYVRTTSSNYYESWYRSPTDNITLDIDVTYANSTAWDCYWRKCPASELVTDNINISAKVIKYDEWKQKDYPASKYTVSFTNNSVLSNTTSSLTTFQDVGSQTNVSINTTRNVAFSQTSFTSGSLFNSTIANVTLQAAGYDASTILSIPQNATINSASITVAPFQSNLTVNLTLNNTSPFFNHTINGSSATGTFTSNLNSLLSSCTADANGNCTVAFNVTLNSSGALNLLNLHISYNQARATAIASNSSTLITISKNSTINSAFINISATSGNFVANITLNDTNFATSFFNTTNLNTTANNVSFGSALSRALSLCTSTSISGNCTLGFNVTLNGTGTVTLSGLSISYATSQTIQNTSLWYINTTKGNANLTFIPRGGKSNNTWETGYYSAAVIVDGPQGKETGTYWFEIRSFFVNLQPVKPTNSSQTTFVYTSGQNITVNVSATDRPSWLTSSYSVSATNIAASITAMRLSYWDQTTYQMKQTPVTWSPSTINGTTTVNIKPSSTLAAGNWYNLEVTLTDSNGNNGTGWASFQIKDFTFSARTKNWQYEFNNTENISLDVAVCGGDTWYCNFGFNSYSGAAVNVTVAKLAKSDTWPYTPISGWTANTSILNSTNTSNGQGIVTIVPTSSLSGGYYTADLTARYNDGSGSPVTTNVWFRIQSFKLSVSTLKWDYRMSENVTVRITPNVAATLSDVYMSCGYWPEQTTYSKSGATLSTNATSDSLNAGDNIIMLSPSGGKKWVSGYCSGYITVTSGGESQQAYVSFSVKAFALSASQSKYTYLKNETVVLKVTSDADQYFNISDINITFYNYENGSDITLKLGQHFASNATGKSFKGNATINLNATDFGNWTLKGWHNGKLTALDSNNSAISQQTWLYFDIRDVLYAYGWPVSPGTTNYYNPNATSENISLIVYTYRYNIARTDWWPYDSASNVSLTITSIERQSCSSYPCSYANVTGWTSASGTSKSDGTAQMNITRSGGWTSGWHYLNMRLLDNTTGETAVLNKQIGFWVNS